MNFPILSAITFLPLVGSIIIFITKDSSDNYYKNSKNVAIFTSVANFFLSIFLLYSFNSSTHQFQFLEAS